MNNVLNPNANIYNIIKPKYNKIVAKIFILVDDEYFLFSKKNSDDNIQQNGKLELLGGGFDSVRDSNLFETLIRELEEEELSKHLSRIAKNDANFFKSIDLTNKYGLQLYELFVMKIDMYDFERVKNNFFRDESFGYKLISKKDIQNQDWLNRNLYKFTSKTKKLFSKINLSKTRLFPNH